MKKRKILRLDIKDIKNYNELVFNLRELFGAFNDIVTKDDFLREIEINNSTIFNINSLRDDIADSIDILAEDGFEEVIVIFINYYLLERILKDYQYIMFFGTLLELTDEKINQFNNIKFFFKGSSDL